MFIRNTSLYRQVVPLLMLLVFLALTAAASEKKLSGRFMFVHGNVWVQENGGTKQLAQKGGPVYEMETIITDAKGSAQLVMVDGAYIAVRPDTKIQIEVYQFEEEKEETGKAVLSLLKGCFRSVTGMIGRKNKENYRIKTPVANIGIRGTDHEPLYISPTEKSEIYIGEPGVYDKVNSGETYLENEAGTINILPNQVGYAPDLSTPPSVLDTIPDVYYKDITPSPSAEPEDSTGDDSPTEEETESQESDIGIGQIEDIPSKIEQVVAGITADGTLIDFTNQEITSPPAVEPQPETPQLLDVYYGYFSWPDGTNLNGNIGFIVREDQVETDSSNYLTGWDLSASHPSPNPEWTESVRLVNPASPTYGESSHFSETGIAFGTWEADAIERTSFGGTVETFPVGNGLVHWIMGKTAYSDYLSQVITGTQSFTLDGFTSPTNQDGVSGVLNSASLSVDFTRQSVNAAIDLTVNSHNWAASASGIPLDRSHFTASSPFLAVQLDGVYSPSAWGYLNGSLVGEDLKGALLSYTLGDTAISETVNGVASFYAPAQVTSSPYREIGFATTDTRLPMPAALAAHTPNAQSRINSDGAGNLTGFDAALPKYSPIPSATDDRTPVHFDMGTASLTDTGRDADTGISWGRWSNGTINATERTTGTSTSPTFSPSDIHFIAGPEMSSPVSLPLNGTATYQFAGGTHPTDNLGNVGTLNSAALTANFTEMTVSTGLNATVGGVTFDASTAAVPIENGRYFSATHNDALNVSCTGSGAGTSQSGVISGAFHGQTGEGAGLAYSLNTTDGATIDTTVSGAAAFKRQ